MAYQTEVDADTPKVWLKFDETSGTPANSGTGSSSISKGTSITQGVTPRDNLGTYAISGSGGNQSYVQASGTNSWVTDRTWSFEMWVKTSESVSNGTSKVLANSQSTTEYWTIKNLGDATNGKLFVEVKNSAQTKSITSTTQINDGNWHHVVITFDGTTTSSQVLTVYLDGSSIGTQTFTSGLMSNLSAGFRVGNNSNDAASASWDEAALYDYKLTSTDVTLHWDEANPSVSVNYTDTAGMATATPHAVFADPAISVQTNVQYTADPMLVTNAELPGPVISANAEVSYAVDPATASSEAVDPAIATTSNVEYTDTASTASALAVDPIVSAQVYVSIAADPATATADLSNNVFYGMTVQDADYHVEVRQINHTVSNTALTTGSGDLGAQMTSTSPQTYNYVSIAMKPQSGFPAYNKIVKAKIDFNNFTINATADESPYNTYRIYVFTEAPSSNFSSMDYDNLPAKELLYTTREVDEGGSPNNNTDQYIDLTAAFRDPRSVDYGILIECVGNPFNSSLDTYDRTIFTPTSGNDWRYNSLYILTSDIQLVNVDATSVTASAEMADPSITTINNISLAADVITASAELVEAVASSAQNFEHFDTPWTASSLAVDPTILPEMVYVVGHLEASADFVDPTLDIEGTYIYYSSEPMGTASAEFASAGWNIGEENQATHMDAEALMADPLISGSNIQFVNEMNGNSALMTDATITTVLNSQTVLAEPMEANAAFPNPVYSRALDPYYSRIRELLGDADNSAGAKPSYLFIFDGLDSDTYGWKPTIKNANWISTDGDFNSFGITAGGIVPAPGGRKGQTLTNTGVTYSMGEFNSTGRFNGSKSAVEAVLRVSEANAGQFYHRRYISSLGGGSEVRLSINNGKIRFELWSRGSNSGFSLAQAYEGFKTVSDGQWHHIIVNFSDDVVNGPNYFDIYIDGERDFKRFQGMSNATKGRYPSLVANFTGDIQSIAHYELELSQDDIVKNYYLALDIDAIEAEPMLADITLVNAKKVRGNRKRMLVLYTGYSPGFYQDGVRLREGGQLITDDREFDYDFGPLIPVYENTSVGNSWADVDVFTAPIIGPWRDPISDDFRTIDLRTDVALADFDIVSFRDYPNESTEFDAINTRDIGGTTGAKLRDVWQKERETFARNLLLAINLTGTSLYVNDPQLAIDLGIVDRVVQFEDIVETGGSIDVAGNGAGAFDPRSYDLDPFNGNGRGTNTTPLAQQGIGFSDTHTLAFQRIINEIPGITDAASRSGRYICKEVSRFIPYSPFAIDRYSFKYAEAALNEDFYITNVGRWGTYGGPEFRQQQFGGVGDRWDIIAVPAANVKAGTIVTAISPTYYNGRTATANPYAGYATTIAIQPGQSINNIQMNAKVFVSFTEPMQTAVTDSTVRFQDQTQPITQLSASDIDYMWGGEAANWQYSTWRHSTSLRNVNASVPVNTGPQYQSGTGQTAKQNEVSADTVEFTNITLPTVQIYFNYREYNAPRFTPSNAGFRWLSIPTVINEEDAIIRPSAITAVAQITEATVSLEINREIFAPLMVSAADIIQPTNYGLPDTIGLALPMNASAQMESEVKVIRPEPMTVTANIGQNFTITVSGEQVVLTLAHADAVLYIKEDINN